MNLPDAMDLVEAITSPSTTDEHAKAIPQLEHRVAIRRVLRAAKEALKIADELSRAVDSIPSRMDRA